MKTQIKNTLHGTALAAGLLGALALAATPALANPAHHGGGSGQLAQAQDQQPARGAPAPGQQPPAGGQGMMGGQGSGGGMMGGQGSSGGMMGGQGMDGGMAALGPCGMMGGMRAGGDKGFSAEQVKDIVQGQIAWTGNERLKVGTVEKKDEDTYVVEIVTVDDSLVQTLEVNRKTAAIQPGGRRLNGASAGHDEPAAILAFGDGR